MATSATARMVRLAPQKARLVVDQIRGKPVNEAVDILHFGVQKGAPVVSKVLHSAIANAETNEGADVDELYVSRAVVHDGVRLKRIKARARGRIDQINKRTCHITIEVTENAA